MSSLAVTIIVVAVLALLFYVGAIWARGHVYSSLEQSIAAGDLDAFFRRVDSRACRALLAPYGRELLRFRALALGGDRAVTAAQLDRLLALKLTAYERSCVLTEAFNAFASMGDAKMCRRIVGEMEGAGFAQKALAAYRRHLEVALEHRPEAARGLDQTYQTLRGKRRAYAAYLLSKASEARGDASSSAEYRSAAASLYGCSETELDGRAHVVTTV